MTPTVGSITLPSLANLLGMCSSKGRQAGIQQAVLLQLRTISLCDLRVRVDGAFYAHQLGDGFRKTAIPCGAHACENRCAQADCFGTIDLVQTTIGDCRSQL